MSADTVNSRKEPIMAAFSTLAAVAAATFVLGSPLAAQSGGDGAPPVERAPRPERTDRTVRDQPRPSGDARADRVTQSQPTPDRDARSLLGVVLSTSGNARDTLGLLVSALVPGGAAEQAGIEEGNRVAAINGVSLRVPPASIGDPDAVETVTRRLDRELVEIRAGDEVTLRVTASGRSRTVTLEAGRVSRTAAAATSARDGGRDSEPAVPTLASIAEQVAKLQEQIRLLAAREQVPGLEVSPVADEMVPYFGEGSESGLLVLKADRSWDPLRPGDVILRVDDQMVTLDRLRAAPTARRGATIELIRRKRVTTVTVEGSR